MRSMGHPDYKYTPVSAEKRARMSAAHKRRLGIPEGHSRLYGMHVPVADANAVRSDATWLANKEGWEAAQALIRRAREVDWDLIGEMLLEGTTLAEIGEFFGMPEWFVERQTKRFRRINRRRVYRG
jgi:hypothetical protein